MAGRHYRRSRRPRRGVSTIIATVLLVGITLTAGLLLWKFRPNVPSPSPSFSFQAVGNVPEPTWGDPTDCSPASTPPQECQSLPATFIIVTSHFPSVIPVADLSFTFVCNGTVYLTAKLQAMEWVPGTTGAPSGSAPQLGSCGSYVPPRAAFNRLAFFDQTTPGALNLANGDALVIYQRTFLQAPGLNCLTTREPGCDDDFHGTPPWCVTVVGDCAMSISYSAPGFSGVVASIPMTTLGGADACPPECIIPNQPP